MLGWLWLQNFNFKFGASRCEKRRGLAFYTGTSCLTCVFLGGERGKGLLKIEHCRSSHRVA